MQARILILIAYNRLQISFTFSVCINKFDEIIKFEASLCKQIDSIIVLCNMQILWIGGTVDPR
jgi:hypothetical protein